MLKTFYNFEGKLVLVTGGGSGLGLGISKIFIEAGASVVITGRGEEKLKKACNAMGESASYIVNDITELDSLPGLVEKIESEIAPIDILVNNAGINLKKHTRDVSDKEFNDIIQTNLNGLFSLSREVASRMMKRESGVILNITSMAAIYGIPQVTAYTASKTGLLGLTRALAVDLSPHGIRVNAIAPGFIDSPMLRKAFDSDPDRANRVLERTPMKKLGEPEDIATAALFLTSDAAKFITGVNLPVDGGNSIGF
ncbi:SDR family oxidoreductase [Rhodohalobacter sp. SW132]|uniref:SDR family NAD(P)-dependent oxidoreductase n=1 Tax=Rhodohalobacter sp. SW132 TaxID=2293433 RepID=UPI000E2783A0|nr:glucose 1-dehydrogenase [Rhodohalobacter sp. SW132]REL38117.1 SDR family oxidoreductase [Rhodohalobacter sp. SW132]